MARHTCSDTPFDSASRAQPKSVTNGNSDTDGDSQSDANSASICTDNHPGVAETTISRRILPDWYSVTVWSIYLCRGDVPEQ